MGIVDRVRNICVSPNTEWPVIAAEPASPGGLISGYAAPLMAVGAVAGLIGGSIVGISVPFAGTVRTPIVTGVVAMCFGFVLGLVALFVLSLIINALAPTFGGVQDSTQALKTAVYSYTPAWVAGVLHIIPALGVLSILAGLYSLYLLYLGLPVLMKAPREKAAGYTAVVVICAIVLSVVTGVVLTAIGFGAAGASGVAGMFGNASSASNEVQFDPNSPLGKLEELGKAMEQSSKQMEAAGKSGDPNAAASAAMNSLGTLLGGGRRVDSLELDQLKTFIPETFAGLARQGGGSVEKNGIAGLMVSRAEAQYGTGNETATLEIVDTGGASGIMGLASWAALQGSREDDYGSERTSRVDGRLVHEKRTKEGADEYAIVLGERFMVTARSSEMDVEALKAAVSRLDLARLESLKEVGVAKP